MVERGKKAEGLSAETDGTEQKVCARILFCREFFLFLPFSQFLPSNFVSPGRRIGLAKYRPHCAAAKACRRIANRIQGLPEPIKIR